MLNTPANSTVLRRLAAPLALVAIMGLTLGVTSANDTHPARNASGAPVAFASSHTPEFPVNGRDLLHDHAADETRDPMTTDSASPAVLPVEKVLLPRVIEMEVTAYCPCKKCCGPKAQGITASGHKVNYNNGLFVAADKALPFGTKLIIPGYADNKPVEVIDRGGAIKGNKLDVYFSSHDVAKTWGRKKLLVTVVE